MKYFTSLSNAGRMTGLLAGIVGGLASCQESGYDDISPDPVLESQSFEVLVATLEAEKATLSGAVVASSQPGFTGTGFVDYLNPSGDFIEWSADIAAAGKYTLTIRYANAGSTSRPLSIVINGTVAQANLAFPKTGSTWSTWGTVAFTTDLIAGKNRIRATAIGSSGGNVDNLVISTTSTGGGTGGAGGSGTGGSIGTGGGGGSGTGGVVGTGGGVGSGGSIGTGGAAGGTGGTGTGGAGAGGAGGSSGGVPTAADLLALTRACTQISSGKYATDEGGAATVPVCKLNGAVFWKADMDIDCDGKSTSTCNSSTDPWYQSQTSFGSNIDAATLPYVVVPLPSSKFNYTKQGIAGGQSVAVIYNGKLAYGVFVDEGPADIIGEASVAMANALGIPSNPKNGGVDSGVTYIVFTGTNGVVAPITSTAQATTIGQARAADLLKSN